MLATLPPVDPPDTSFLQETIAVELALFVGLAAVALLVAVIAIALIRAGKLPHPISLVLALAILGGMALAVSIIANEPAAYIGVAGTAVGALSAAVAATYKTDGDTPPPPPPSEMGE